jgi:hypothetical protein
MAFVAVKRVKPTYVEYGGGGGGGGWGGLVSLILWLSMPVFFL